MNLFQNFARHAKDIERLNPGETLLVGMPGSILAGQALLLSHMDLQSGVVELHNITNLTSDLFSGMVRDLIRKPLTRAQDERFIIKGGPINPHDGYIITENNWGGRFLPDPCGYFHFFTSEIALNVIAEGFGPHDFMVLRGHTDISVQEFKNLLDRNIIVAVDAHPDVIFSRNLYDEAVENAAHLSMVEKIFPNP